MRRAFASSNRYAGGAAGLVFGRGGRAAFACGAGGFASGHFLFGALMAIT